MRHQQLIELANATMPFGKYQGRPLMKLPEEYLLWFEKKGWPPGKLGQHMAMMLELKVEGLETLLEPIRSNA